MDLSRRPIDPIRAHLEAALAAAEDPEQKRHLREALQLVEAVTAR